MHIHKGQGITPTEKILANLCEKVFLPLWSFPNVFRARNKELCDLLAMSGNDIFVFSDKEVGLEFLSVDNNAEGDSGKKNAISWQRWLKRAIFNSDRQIRRAEAWIRKYPDQIFKDNVANVPLRLPCDVNKLRIHLVLVANGAQRAMAEFWGENSPPTLLLNSFFKGDLWSNIAPSIVPIAGAEGLFSEEGLKAIGGAAFQVGDLDPARSFVHIFDEMGIRIVMEEMDTGTDLIGYLAKREALVRNNDLNFLADEAALLSHYLSHIDEDSQQHDFFFAANADPDTKGPNKIIGVNAVWGGGNKSRDRIIKQFRAKHAANQISYFWDMIISQMIESDPHLYDSDNACSRAIAIMAQERRFDRRMICKHVFPYMNMAWDVPCENNRWLGMRPSETAPGCLYVFLATAETNIAKQKRILDAACVLALTREDCFPECQRRMAVGIFLGEDDIYATSVAKDELDRPRIYKANQCGKKHKIFKKVKMSRQQGNEFPDVPED